MLVQTSPYFQCFSSNEAPDVCWHEWRTSMSAEALPQCSLLCCGLILYAVLFTSHCMQASYVMDVIKTQDKRPQNHCLGAREWGTGGRRLPGAPLFALWLIKGLLSRAVKQQGSVLSCCGHPLLISHISGTIERDQRQRVWEGTGKWRCCIRIASAPCNEIGSCQF